MSETKTASETWSRELAAWELPPAILDAAPRDPYEFSAAAITTPSVPPLTTPTGEAVLARLEPGEALLDIGCGAGRISGAFVPTHRVVGVEPRGGLATTAAERGIDVHEGRWPDCGDLVDPAPVVLCTHVMYDVSAAAPFVRGLHGHATRRVVIEVTRRHPWVPIGPLYRLVHDIDRPTGPTSEMLVDLITEALGVVPEVRHWSRPGSLYPDLATLVDHERRMLCIGSDHPMGPALTEKVSENVTIEADGSVRLPDVDQTTLWWETDRR